MLIKNDAEQRRPFGNPMFQIQSASVGINVPDSDDTGMLQLGRIDHSLIKPGFVVSMHPHENDEIFSYIRQGAMTHEDTQGNVVTISSTKLMMMNSGSGIQHEETVPNDGDDVEMLQIFIRPEQAGLEPNVQFHEFPTETSVDEWRLLAGHKNSHAPLTIYSGIKVFDNHLTQASDVTIGQDKRAVIYLFEGRVTVNGDVTLGKGDSLVADETLQIRPLAASADLVLFELDEKVPFSRSGAFSG